MYTSHLIVYIYDEIHPPAQQSFFSLPPLLFYIVREREREKRKEERESVFVYIHIYISSERSFLDNKEREREIFHLAERCRDGLEKKNTLGIIYCEYDIHSPFLFRAEEAGCVFFSSSFVCKVSPARGKHRGSIDCDEGKSIVSRADDSMKRELVYH